jgi:hypothetical protein
MAADWRRVTLAGVVALAAARLTGTKATCLAALSYVG